MTFLKALKNFERVTSLALSFRVKAQAPSENIIYDDKISDDQGKADAAVVIFHRKDDGGRSPTTAFVSNKLQEPFSRLRQIIAWLKCMNQELKMYPICKSPH